MDPKKFELNADDIDFIVAALDNYKSKGFDMDILGIVMKPLLTAKPKGMFASGEESEKIEKMKDDEERKARERTIEREEISKKVEFLKVKIGVLRMSLTE